MSPRVIFAGWCDGGPLAGQRLAHDAPRCRVPMLAPPDAQGIRIIEGEYFWDEGAWRWHGPGIEGS